MKIANHFWGANTRSTTRIAAKLQSFVLAILAVSFFSLSACKKDEEPEEEEEEPIAAVQPTYSASEADLHFYHAWLAQCANNSTSDASTVTSTARTDISGAIANSTLTAEYGTTELVWGPQAVANAGDPSADGYTSGQLMYCLKASSGSGDQHYYVGIASTKNAAAYELFRDDLEVDSQVELATGKGKISAGAARGLNNLKTMTDPTSSQTLEAFLTAQEPGDYTVHINVAGHSLGGMHAQAYASHLNSAVGGAKKLVYAWTFGAPAAGNATFASQLVADLGSRYSAYNNSKDAVTRAWRNDQLEGLCTLYDGETICGDAIASCVAINGVKRVLTATTAGTDYATPGTPTSFSVTVPERSSSACTSLDNNLFAQWEEDLPGSMYDYLNRIYGHCDNGNFISEVEFNRYYLYMVELGDQHNSAYVQHFIEDEAVRTAVGSYVETYENAPGSVAEGTNSFLLEISNYMQSNSITDCPCQ